MSSDQPRRFLIAYDITDDGRRTRIADLLGSHGDRIQFSVFLLTARPARLIRLRAQLTGMIDPVTDSILTCDLGPQQRPGPTNIEFIGRSRTITSETSLII